MYSWNRPPPLPAVSQLPPEVHLLIDSALTEDQTFNDPTTQALVPPDIKGVGMVRAKAHGVLAGTDVAVLGSYDGFLYVQSPDGNTGWLVGNADL